MKAFVDTNVILDYVLQREHYIEAIFHHPSSILTTFIRHSGIGPLLAFSLQN